MGECSADEETSTTETVRAVDIVALAFPDLLPVTREDPLLLLRADAENEFRAESSADEETLAMIDDTDELDEVRVALRLPDKVDILEGRTVEVGVSATVTVLNVLAVEYKDETGELGDEN